MKAITIAGNVTRDSEIKGGNMDKARFVTFAVAVDDGYGQNKSTIFFDCTWFGSRAEKVAAYIKKGQKVAVSGEFTTREYNGKTYMGVRVNDLTLQGGKPMAEREQPTRTADALPVNHLDDDIPW
jgi:single-strand DNA-binding protein